MKKNITAFFVTVIVVIAIIPVPYYLTIGFDNLLGFKHEIYKLMSWLVGLAIMLAIILIFGVFFVLYNFIYELLYD